MFSFLFMARVFILIPFFSSLLWAIGTQDKAAIFSSETVEALSKKIIQIQKETGYGIEIETRKNPTDIQSDLGLWLKKEEERLDKNTVKLLFINEPDFFALLAGKTLVEKSLFTEPDRRYIMDLIRNLFSQRQPDQALLQAVAAIHLSFLCNSGAKSCPHSISSSELRPVQHRMPLVDKVFFQSNAFYLLLILLSTLVLLILIWNFLPKLSDHLDYSLTKGILFFFLIGSGIFLRGIFLNHIPGLNSDEGMHALEVHHFLQKSPVQHWLPSGRLANPFYWLVSTPFELLFPQTALTLRLPAFFSGILILLLTFFLFKNRLGVFIAAASTVLAASSPALTAYSRVAIETCMIPITALLILYCSIEEKWRWLIWVFPLALLFHPLSAFLVFIPLTVFVSRYPWKKSVPVLLLIAGLGVLLLLYIPSHNLFYVLKSKNRLSETFYFSHLFISLLTGTSVFTGFATPLGVAGTLIDVIAAFAFTAVFVLGMRSLYRSKDRTLFYSCVGFFIGLFFQALICGGESILPGRERYALSQVAPFLVFFSLCLFRIKKRFEKKALWTVFGIAFLFQGLFLQFYLLDFLSTGGGNGGIHLQLYKAGPVDGSVGTIEVVREAVKSEKRKAHILTEGWLTEPVRYLSLNDPGIETVGIPPEPARIAVMIQEAIQNCDYISAIEGQTLQSILQTRKFNLTILKVFQDYSGKPMVTVYRGTDCEAK